MQILPMLVIFFGIQVKMAIEFTINKSKRKQIVIRI